MSVSVAAAVALASSATSVGRIRECTVRDVSWVACKTSFVRSVPGIRGQGCEPGACKKARGAEGPPRANEQASPF